MRIHFSNKFQLFMIIIQAASYLNACIVQTIIFPLPFFLTFLFFILNILSISAHLKANSTHYSPNPFEKASYCKTCKYKVLGRDHHCALIGRCVEKQNYHNFFAYVLYSYILSVLLVVRILFHLRTFVTFFRFSHYWGFFSLWFGLVSGVYFGFFTGGLLSECIGLMIGGLYKVEEMKKTKKPKYTKRQIAKMLFNPRNWKILQNWSIMVGKGIAATLIPL